MSEYVYTSVPLSSLSSSYIELKPHITTWESSFESRYRNEEHSGIVKGNENTGLISGEILGWSVSRYGSLLSVYKVFIHPHLRTSEVNSNVLENPGSDSSEKGFCSLEFRLPSAAICEPLVFEKSDKNFIRVMILCDWLLLVVLDIPVNQKGLMNIDIKNLNVFELRRELKLIGIDDDDLKQNLYTSPGTFGNFYLSGSGGVVIEISTSEKKITSIENSHLKLRNLTKKLPNWRADAGMSFRKNSVIDGDITHDSMRLLATHCTKVEKEQYLFCILDSAIVLIDVRRTCVAYQSVISKTTINEKKNESKNIGEVLLYNDGSPMVKFNRFPMKTVICIGVKTYDGEEGMLIYSIDHELLLLNSQRKGDAFELEIVNYAKFDEDVTSEYKIVDFDSVPSCGYKMAGNYSLFVLHSKLDSHVLTHAVLRPMTDSNYEDISWKRLNIPNRDASEFLSGFSDMGTNYILEHIFDGNVGYSLLREALLNFMDQNNLKSSFIDMAYDIQKFKSISYYAIVNLARKLITDLYNENYAHTLGNEKLHKVILNNSVQNFIEKCRDQYIKSMTPLCIKYDEDLSCHLSLGVRSIGILRECTYSEHIKKFTSDIVYPELLTFSALIDEVPLNINTIKDVLTVLLHRRYSGNSHDIFKKLSGYVFKKTSVENAGNFLKIISTINNHNDFFSDLLTKHQFGLAEINKNNNLHDTYTPIIDKCKKKVHAANTAGKFQLVSAQLALESYTQISLSIYNNILNMVLVILYAYSIDGVNLIIDLKTLNDILVALNCAALHRLLSSEGEPITCLETKSSKCKSVLPEEKGKSQQDDEYNMSGIERDTDAQNYYHDLEFDFNTKPSVIKIEKPVIIRSNLMCLFNSYKCLDSECYKDTKNLSNVVVSTAFKFINNVKSLFNIDFDTLCSTNHTVRLVMEMVKIGSHEIAEQVIGMCGNNPLISYISARFASDDGLFDNARKGYDHFASYIINVYSKNHIYAREYLALLSGLLPAHIIESPDAYGYYMHVLNDCSTSKLNKSCASFTAYFANMALLSSQQIKMPKDIRCIREILLCRIFDSYIEMNDIDACFDLMAESIHYVDLGYFAQRILKHCTIKNRLDKLITMNSIKPYTQLFMKELSKNLKSISISSDINLCFQYACCLFSLYIKEYEHKKACSLMYGFSLVITECIKRSLDNDNKAREYLKILCMSYLPVINVLQKFSKNIPCFSLQHPDLDYENFDNIRMLSKSNDIRTANKDALPKLKFLSDLKIEYLRFFSILNYIKNNGKKLVEMNIFMNETALKLYIENQDYSMAFNFARKCGIDLSEVYISLTRLCLGCLSNYSPKLPQCVGAPPNYVIPGNADILQDEFIPQTEKIWAVLKNCLSQEQNGSFYDYKYHYIVAEYILNSQKIQDIPFWLLTVLKNNCIDRLILLYLNNDDIITAASILSKELLERKDILVKENHLPNTNIISPYLIDKLLIQLRDVILKIFSVFDDFKNIIPDSLYYEYDFDSYLSFVKLIQEHPNYDQISQKDKLLLECASRSYNSVDQYVKAVNNTMKSTSA